MAPTLALPLLSTRPSYQMLLDLLLSLEIKPSTWTEPGIGSGEQDISDQRAVNTWLPTIFRSDLLWLDDTTDANGNVVTGEAQREEIVDLAARRMAERCGRSATSDITRTWSIPSKLVPGSCEDLELTIHEPGLTEGNTGHKTWGTAFALITELASHKTDTGFFAHMFTRSSARRILELGSGTGLLGISAAAIWSCPVVLTDLHAVVPNLRRNVERNVDDIRERGGDLQVETLDWADHDAASGTLPSSTFELILASDPLYDDEQVYLLSDVINRFLDSHGEGRALVAVPLRDQFSKDLLARFQQQMKDNGFKIVNHGFVLARDDFGGGQDEVTVQRDIYSRDV